MRFRASVNSSTSPDAAGKEFANHLLDSKLDWKDLTVQLTGTPARMLISPFWTNFANEMKEQAPLLYPDVLDIKWICDHDFQEDAIKPFLV
jgi:hypothetical protein